LVKIIHVSEKLFGILVASKSDPGNHFWDILESPEPTRNTTMTLASSKNVQKFQKTFERHSKLGQTPRVEIGLNQTQWLQLWQSMTGIYLSRGFCFSAGVSSELKFL